MTHNDNLTNEALEAWKESTAHLPKPETRNAARTAMLVSAQQVIRPSGILPKVIRRALALGVMAVAAVFLISHFTPRPGPTKAELVSQSLASVQSDLNKASTAHTPQAFIQQANLTLQQIKADLPKNANDPQTQEWTRENTQVQRELHDLPPTTSPSTAQPTALPSYSEGEQPSSESEQSSSEGN